MTQFLATLDTQLLEAHRRIIQTSGTLHAAERPLPRLTYEQSVLLCCLTKHVAHVFDLLALARLHCVITPKPGTEKLTVPELPFLDAIARIPLPGEPAPPFVPEIATCYSEDSANKLLATGQWGLRETVQVLGWVLERKETK